MPTRQNLVIAQGKTFSQALRWEIEPLVYVSIIAITQAAPAVITTAGPHGLVSGWRAAVVSVDGMDQINAHAPVRSSDYRPVTKISATQLSFNAVNSADFDPYTSGGYLQYYTMQSLSGMTARMSIKDKIGGTVLLSLTDGNGRITIDDTNKLITLAIPAAITAAITWASGVYDLEMVDGAGVVSEILFGSVSVSKEVTT